MKVLKSLEEDLEIPQLDLLTLLFGTQTKVEIIIVATTNQGAESKFADAKEDTKLHVEAANPSNYITKSEARSLVKRLAYVLRHRYGIGASGPGRDIVQVTSCGNPFVPIVFYSIVAAGGIFSGASTAYRSAELTRQIKDAGSELTLLICTTEYESITVDAAEQCGIPTEKVLVLDYKVPHQWTLRESSTRKDILQAGDGRHLEWERITSLQ